eukprot:1163395-Pleurochrysis_carterae.AAC.1
MITQRLTRQARPSTALAAVTAATSASTAAAAAAAASAAASTAASRCRAATSAPVPKLLHSPTSKQRGEYRAFGRISHVSLQLHAVVTRRDCAVLIPRNLGYLPSL